MHSNLFGGSSVVSLLQVSLENFAELEEAAKPDLSRTV